MKRILFLNELKDSLYLGIKFGVAGAVFGFILHVIWRVKNGLNNNNCVNSYFLALNILEDKREYSFNKYNTFPSF